MLNHETNRSKIIARNRARNHHINAKATLPGYDADIELIYAAARALGLTVDHVWPLKGKNSCGLHVPWNLQLLTSRDNDQKGNKEPIDYWLSPTFEPSASQ